MQMRYGVTFVKFLKILQASEILDIFCRANSISRLRQKSSKDGILRSLEMINSDRLINSCSNRAEQILHCVLAELSMSDKQILEFLIVS